MTLTAGVTCATWPPSPPAPSRPWRSSPAVAPDRARLLGREARPGNRPRRPNLHRHSPERTAGLPTTTRSDSVELQTPGLPATKHETTVLDCVHVAARSAESGQTLTKSDPNRVGQTLTDANQNTPGLPAKRDCFGHIRCPTQWQTLKQTPGLYNKTLNRSDRVGLRACTWSNVKRRRILARAVIRTPSNKT